MKETIVRSGSMAKITHAIKQENDAANQATTKTAFTYDAAGNRITVTNDHGGTLANSVSYTYDRLGRMLTQDDPDHGLYTYTYDALGQRLTEISPTMAAASSSPLASLGVAGATTFKPATAVNQDSTL